MPVVLPDIEVFAGDPKTIKIRIKGQDRSAHDFTSQIRRRERDTEVVAVFNVTKAAVADPDDSTKTDTLITLNLAGDSAAHLQDGLTRFPEGVRSAYFDVQESANGVPVETVAFGRLVQKRDVTR